MPKAPLAAVLALTAALVPAPAAAWGTAAHRFIMSRAIDLLPAEIRPFFTEHRDEMVMRVVDPDLFRTLGWDDDANHFVNFGMKEYGDYPFRALPREYGAAIEKFGMAVLKRGGLLPWREQEEFGNLRRAFEGFNRETYATGNAVLFAAVAAHYIQDAHQPLHATVNYDGQMTGNTGIHARFESALYERFHARMTVQPAAPAPMSNARDAAFDALISGYRLVDGILHADDEAKQGREMYDDGYFEALFSRVRPVLEQRLAESITATAAMIAGAWEQAGRPVLKAQGPRPPQKIKR